MPRPLLAFFAVLFCVVSLSPQTPLVHIKIRVILVDKDLNQKPVPFLVMKAKNAATGTEQEIKTGLDGTAQIDFPAGHSVFSTAKSVDFGGKKYSWNLEADVKGAEQEIVFTNDNAKIENGTPETSAANSSGSGDLTALFDKLKNSVVTVHSESGTGSGFVADASGLIVTNNHVVDSSSYLAVQFDSKRKVPARLLAADANKDVAVLWVNLSAFPESIVAPVVAKGASSIVVGQRVFTIGNPMGREKVLTTGVISKVDKEAITSDININPGNSGGPLFTLGGEVAGLTTAGLRNLASIVPIETARPLLDQAKKTIGSGVPPSASLLPVEPAEYFPADYLRGMLQQEKLDSKPYFFDVGQFRVAFLTPPVSYFYRHEDEMAALRKAAKRSSGDPSQAKPPESAIQDAQDIRPVLYVSVRPKLGAGWTKMHFKNGFKRMRLLCGGKEMEPIEPGRGEYELLDFRGRTVDTTFQGRYSYLPDAISPSCGTVVLEIYSEKEPDTPLIKAVEQATIDRIWADLEPYRKSLTKK
ncbi:MAG TPA: trypsin-like peptidase domain-containing protein [Candidatus Dormibacteraeota bacterium]|jgi:S1-C subfamily serine protease|nr:trypsin-like peptidase domain-containing protein [Candidatus Dormibacteraeota bacterium]